MYLQTLKTWIVKPVFGLFAVLWSWLGPVRSLFFPQSENKAQVRRSVRLGNILSCSAVVGYGLLVLCLCGGAPLLDAYPLLPWLARIVGVLSLGWLGNRIAAIWVVATRSGARYPEMTEDQHEQVSILGAKCQGISLLGLTVSQVLALIIPAWYAAGMHIDFSLKSYEALNELLNYSTVTLFAAGIGLSVMVFQNWEFRGSGIDLPPLEQAFARGVALLVWGIFFAAWVVIVGGFVLVCLGATGPLVEWWSIVAPVAINCVVSIMGAYVVVAMLLGRRPRGRKYFEMIEQMAVVQVLLSGLSQAVAQGVAQLPHLLPWLHYSSDQSILTGLLLIAMFQPHLENVKQWMLVWWPIKAKERAFKSWAEKLQTGKQDRLLKRYQEEGDMEGLYGVLSIAGIDKVLPLQALEDHFDLIVTCLLAERSSVSAATRDRRFRRFLKAVQKRWKLDKCLAQSSETVKELIARQYLTQCLGNKDRSAHRVGAQDWDEVHQGLLTADQSEVRHLWETLAADGAAANQYLQGLAHEIERSHMFLPEAEGVLVSGQGEGLVSALQATRPKTVRRLFESLLRHDQGGREVAKRVCQRIDPALSRVLATVPELGDVIDTRQLMVVARPDPSEQPGAGLLELEPVVPAQQMASANGANGHHDVYMNMNGRDDGAKDPRGSRQQTVAVRSFIAEAGGDREETHRLPSVRGKKAQVRR